MEPTMTLAGTLNFGEISGSGFYHGSPLDDFYITMPQLPSQTAVDLYIEQQAHLAPKPRRDPLWAVVCLMIGALCSVAAGVFLIALGIQG